MAWDELATELMIDAFSNIGEYEEVVALVSELFILVREEIIKMKRIIAIEIAKRLNLINSSSDVKLEEEIINYLDNKL